MSAFFGKEELENLKSLKRDLVDPVKSFTNEVYSDTLGDAAKFYSAKALKARENAELARKRTKERMAAIRREQEELKKRRNVMMKRAAIILVLLALFSLLVISTALSVQAAEPDRGRCVLSGITMQQRTRQDCCVRAMEQKSCKGEQNA